MSAPLPDAQRARAALIVQLVRREREAASDRLRMPEPMVISDRRSVDSLHNAGAVDGVVLPLYEAYARSLSRLLPPHGLVLELGCGSAQCVTHFARRRPDARVIGIDLSSEMIRQGSELVRRLGLAANRVRDDAAKRHGVDRFTLISTAEPDLMANDPSRKLMRQIFGCVAEYDKSQLVLKLAAAKVRLRACALSNWPTSCPDPSAE